MEGSNDDNNNPKHEITSEETAKDSEVQSNPMKRKGEDQSEEELPRKKSRLDILVEEEPRKVRLSNIPDTVSVQELLVIAKTHGEVEECVILNTIPKKRYYGYILYTNANDAQVASKAIKTQYVGGVALNVTHYSEKEVKLNLNTEVDMFVSNLGPDVTKEQVAELFSQITKVTDVKITKDPIDKGAAIQATFTYPNIVASLEALNRFNGYSDNKISYKGLFIKVFYLFFTYFLSFCVCVCMYFVFVFILYSCVICTCLCVCI